MAPASITHGNYKLGTFISEDRLVNIKGVEFSLLFRLIAVMLGFLYVVVAALLLAKKGKLITALNA